MDRRNLLGMFKKVFVVWACDDFATDVQQRIQGDDPETLRRLQQQSDGADMVWRSWAMANDGSVITCGSGTGSLEAPPDKLADLPRITKQYAAALRSRIAVGVGARLSEAQRALEAARGRGGDQIVLYSSSIDDELDSSKKKKDPVEDILAQEHLDESAVRKAQSGANAGPGAGFAGFSVGSGAAPPAPPTQEASEHSEAEGLLGQLNDQEAPPAPEMTHAAQGLEDQFHNAAAQQDVKDVQQSQESQTDIAAIKGAVASVLQQVRGQAAALGALKQQAPDAFNAVNALVQSVIAMAHSLQSPSSSIKKSEVMAKVAALEARLEEHKPCKVDGCEKCALEKAKLPMPNAPTHKDLELPVGSVKEGGPGGNAHGDVGKIKVQHGNGKTGWIQARAGQVTAVADRHAPPTLGHASHPISSKNPTGH